MMTPQTRIGKKGRGGAHLVVGGHQLLHLRALQPHDAHAQRRDIAHHLLRSHQHHSGPPENPCGAGSKNIRSWSHMHSVAMSITISCATTATSEHFSGQLQ